MRQTGNVAWYTRRMIGLMDCNNFFVSCERLFRPDLLGKPVAVLSSNDGCIVSRSREVKDLGIPMGIPHFQIKDLCKKHGITLFSSNFALYRDISTRVMAALKEEYDICEVYSVDEAFFTIPDDVSLESLYAVRARITQKTGIPVSIGVARTKTLAKVANAIAKKGDGVCVLDEEGWQRTVEELPCGSVWGIGRQTAAFLSKENISTVGELLRKDAQFIRSNLGVVGERLCLELRGVSVHPVGSRSEDEQGSYTSTRSFAAPVFDKLTLMSALGHHAAHVAEKLRKDGCVASRLTIVARGSRFGTFSHREGAMTSILTIPTNDTFVITKEVSRLLGLLFDPEVPYKKAGVVLGGISHSTQATGSLFAAEDTSKTAQVNMVADALNERFGSGAIRQAVTLGAEKWQEQKKLKSKEYTTQWSEIASVKAIVRHVP